MIRIGDYTNMCPDGIDYHMSDNVARPVIDWMREHGWIHFNGLGCA